MNEKKKKVVAYCRVSTNEQSIGSQLEAIKNYCINQNWELVKVYEDCGISGAKDQRPGLDELKRDCMKQRRGWTGVIAYKYDRIARSVTHLLHCLNLFQSYKIDFISISEGIDTSTSVGKMVFTFLAGIAEFERSLISDRVKAGIEHAKATGKVFGRPRVGFDVAEALRLRNQENCSLRQIGKKLNVSYATVFRTLNGVSKAQ